MAALRANLSANGKYCVAIRAFFYRKGLFALLVFKAPFSFDDVKAMALGIANHVDDGGVSLAWRWP
mgnify:CR=1 FL=1